MCGIAGFVGNGSQEALRLMAKSLGRRGPDDEGFFESDGVGFAFRRLSIIDLTGGHQPMTNAERTICVMLNGEIYNFQDLRRELEERGKVFRTNSDTESIIHAYEEWGDACFEHLDGMFAVALWDATARRLLLSRDRLGKKPLYWTMQDKTLWFASELKALLAADAVRREIDPVALGAYFRCDAVPTPQSIFKNVNKLEPASAIAWSGGAIEKKWSFWSCPEGELNVSLDDAVSGLRQRLDAAVARRLISDVPLGLFLSGGIDSTVVAESAARQSNSRLQAFTIGFDDPSYDERAAAESVARSLGLDFNLEVLRPDDGLSMLDEAVGLLDEPLCDPSILPQLLLSRFTKKSVTVALSGDGGDELFLGYPHIQAHAWLNRYTLGNATRSLLDKALRSIPAGGGYFSLGFKTQRLARGLGETDRWSRDLAWRGAFERSTLADLLVPEVARQADIEGAERALQSRAAEAGESASFWKTWTWGYLRTYLMDVVMVKVDRATMHFGLESRAPLLDTAFVEYVLRLPSSFKTGKHGKKFLLKELVRGRVNDEILDRPKHGFAVPVSRWLSGPLSSRLDECSTDEFLRTQGLFNAEAVHRLRSEHNIGRTDRRKELWAFLAFQLWYKRWRTS